MHPAVMVVLHALAFLHDVITDRYYHVCCSINQGIQGKLCHWVCHQSSWSKVYPRQTWNFRSHAASACISLWCHRPMHACHRPIHACTAYIAPWHHRPMHALTAWALLFWFCLGYTFTSSFFGLPLTFWRQTLTL